MSDITTNGNPVYRIKDYGQNFDATKNSYDCSYKNALNSGNLFNEEAPDKFIPEALKKLYNNDKSPEIVEFGSGEGRNLIGLKKAGYNNLTGCELNEFAWDSFDKRAEREGITGINKVIGDYFQLRSKKVKEILKNKKAFDFAYMAHVFQGCNRGELGSNLSKANSLLKDNGYLVADSLVSTKKRFGLFKMKSSYSIGAASFYEDSIMQIAKENGFEVIDSAPFKETGKRSKYEIEWLNSKEAKKLGIKLKWFVMKKIQDVSSMKIRL